MAMNQKFEEMCARGEVFGSIPEDVIIAAEAELQVSFPPQYRDFLRRFGSGLIGGLEIYGLPDPEKNNPPLWQDVVKVTKQLREWAQSGSENPEYVAIAEDGTGVFFFLDTAVSPNTRIIAIGPGLRRVVSSDFFAFCVDLSEGRIQL